MADATDDFNRANSASMGANWTTVTGVNLNANGFDIVSNTAQPALRTMDSMELWNAFSFPNDQYAQAALTMTGTTTGIGPGVFVRGTTATNGPCYRATATKSATNNVEVLRQDATPAYVSLGQRTTTWVDGDVLRLEVQGTTLRVYQNGTQLGADITDSTYASGSAGIVYSASSATVPQIDTWEAGSLSQTLLPDADLATTGWSIVGGAGSFYASTNDASDSTYASATAS